MVLWSFIADKYEFPCLIFILSIFGWTLGGTSKLEGSSRRMYCRTFERSVKDTLTSSRAVEISDKILFKCDVSHEPCSSVSRMVRLLTGCCFHNSVQTGPQAYSASWTTDTGIRQCELFPREQRNRDATLTTGFHLVLKVEEDWSCTSKKRTRFTEALSASPLPLRHVYVCKFSTVCSYTRTADPNGIYIMHRFVFE
jgi:hypothetical protein